MSTARMPLRSSTDARISSVHGSAPKMPTSSDDARGSIPWRSISSRIARKYDGVTMITRGSKSAMSCTCRSVMPPLTGTTVQPEPLGAVVRPEPAGEQPVAVGDVDQVARAAARGPDRPGHDLGPGVEVRRGVADHGRAARRTAAGVHARDLLARHGEHAERVVVAQVGLGRERAGARGRRGPGRRAVGAPPRRTPRGSAAPSRRPGSGSRAAAGAAAPRARDASDRGSRRPSGQASGPASG